MDYFNTLLCAFDNHLSIGVLRLRDGLDLMSALVEQDQDLSIDLPLRERKITECSETQSTADSGLEDGFEQVDLDPSAPSDGSHTPEAAKKDTPVEAQTDTGILNNVVWSKKSFFGLKRNSCHSILSNEITSKARIFRSKKKLQSTIDVYWLYDDGGLTLLLPHILTTRSMYSKSNLRIFFLSNKMENIDAETLSMAELMAKFRIECKCIMPLDDVTKSPSKATRDQFLATTKDQGEVANSSVKMYAEKINFNLRIAEIVREKSKNADLVVMTLPVPKKDNMPPALYMALIDYITRDMPPFLLVRGNQESVLTYYS